MGINTTIMELKKRLVQEINAAELPISIVQLIVTDILHEITQLTNQAISLEKENDKREDNDCGDIQTGKEGV